MSANLNVLRRRFDLSSGFTLVELLVVIGIIGVLATLVLVQLGGARARARDAKRISDVSQLRSAVELYGEDHQNTYPTAMTDAVLGSYMSNNVVPRDPTTSAVYGYAWTSTAAAPTKYHVWAELEQTGSTKPSALNTDADINSTGWSGATVVGSTEACAASGVDDCIYDHGQN